MRVTEGIGDETDLARWTGATMAWLTLAAGFFMMAAAAVGEFGANRGWWNPAVPIALYAATVIVLLVACVLVFRSRRWSPRRVALPRGVGVNACVSCGQAIDGDEPAARCSECGFTHDALPLGWIDEGEWDDDWSSARPGDEERAAS